MIQRPHRPLPHRGGKAQTAHCTAQPDGSRVHIHRRYAHRAYEAPAPPIDFDEKLWRAVVDHVTVYNDDRLVYSLKDGSEITVMLRKIEKSPNGTKAMLFGEFSLFNS